MPYRANGTELPVYFKNALAMNNAQLNAFEGLILEGVEVVQAGLRKRIKMASFLSYVLDNEQMVAVGSIKMPTVGHKAQVAASSGFSLDPYRGELGWIYVKPDYRMKHLGSRITEGLLEHFADPVYSTTRADNQAIHRLLKSFHFSRVGDDFPSQRHPEVSLCVWISKT
jgi:ribosomal protein S18 acetylase RimI-like enzyme